VIVISAYSNREFYFNGTRYLRNYISRVSGTKVSIFNCYENCDVLVEPLDFDEFIVDGVTFTNANDLQAALNQIIYSRGTLGTDVPELVQDNKFKSVNVTIAADDDVNDIADKINALAAYNVTEFENIFYIAQTAPGVDPSRYAVLYAKGVGKGTYGVGAAQIDAADLEFISDGTTATPVLDQDNIFIKRIIKFDDDNPIIVTVADLINTGPQFIVGEKNLIIFQLRVGMGLYRNFVMLNKGKGVYGTGGTQLTNSNLHEIGFNYLSTEEVEDDPSTQTVDYGALTTQNVSQWLNAQNPAIAIQGQEDGYVLFQGTINGDTVDYIFVGDAGLYGVGQMQSTLEDFQAIPQAPAAPVPPSGQIKILLDEANPGFYKSDMLIGRDINAILANGIMYDDYSLPAEYSFDAALGKISGIEGIASANIVVFYS